MNLPTELVAEIVHWVDSTDLFACSLINKQFHAVVNPMLWRSINVKNEVVFTKVMAGLVESRPPMGKHVRSIHLVPSTTDTQLLDFIKHVPYLEELMMEDAIHIHDASFQHVPRSCPHLKKLVLHDVCAITQPSVMALAQNCYQLSELLLTTNRGLPCVALWALTACPLEVLTIYIDDDDDNKTTITILDDLAKFQHIRRLDFHFCPAYFTEQIITSLTLHPDWMPHLTKFSIAESWCLTVQQATAFMETHPALDALSLRQSVFDDDYLDAIATCLPNICFVGLEYSEGFTAPGIRRLIFDCPLLEWIDLFCCKILALDFPEVDDSCSGWGSREYLYHLDLDAIRSIRLVEEENHDDGDDNEDDWGSYEAEEDEERE